MGYCIRKEHQIQQLSCERELRDNAANNPQQERRICLDLLWEERCGSWLAAGLITEHRLWWVTIN